MAREWQQGQAILILRCPWNGEHPKKARKHAGTELKRQALPADTNDFTQERKRDCWGDRTKCGKIKSQPGCLWRWSERGQKGPGGNDVTEAGRTAHVSSDPERSNRVWKEVTAFHGKKSSVTFTKGVGITKLEIREKSQWIQKGFSSKAKEMGEGGTQEITEDPWGQGGKPSILPEHGNA